MNVAYTRPAYFCREAVMEFILEWNSYFSIHKVSACLKWVAACIHVVISMQYDNHQTAHELFHTSTQ